MEGQTVTADVATSPYLSVEFPVLGRHLPADHGYTLYSAISRVLPTLHGMPWLGIELISGVSCGKGLIALPTKGAALHLRIPADEYRKVLPLSGKRFEIGGHPIRLGLPSARPLVSSSSLYSRIVVIKKFTEPEPFLEAARRQLEAFEITGTLELPKNEEGNHRRRVVRVHDKTVIGFSLAAHGLSDGDSLRLQSLGIGGKRRMGCGIFNPIFSSAK